MCSCSESTPRPAVTTKCSAVSWRGDTPLEGATSPGIRFPRCHTSTTPMPSFKQVSVSYFHCYMIMETKIQQASVSFLISLFSIQYMLLLLSRDFKFLTCEILMLYNLLMTESDIQPGIDCCVNSENPIWCLRYQQKRPSTSSFGYSRSRFGKFRVFDN